MSRETKVVRGAILLAFLVGLWLGLAVGMYIEAWIN